MRIVLVMLLLVLFVPQAQSAEEETELIVFAAASLTDAFTELGEAFTAAHPEIQIILNFGSSSMLATQLVNGAPADIFASANPRQMQVAVDAERIGSEPVIFARNRLVLITPADNPSAIESLADLQKPGLLLVLAAPEVPVRDYTDTMLDLMADAPEYSEAFREAVLANVISEEGNVRQVVTKVALGEADAGVVYSSDITPDIAEDVITFEIPDIYNTIAEYPIAITDDTDNAVAAQAFVDFIVSDEGQAILEKWGFIPLEMETDPEATPEVTPEATSEASSGNS